MKVKIFYLAMALALALSLAVVVAAPLGTPVMASPGEIHVYPGDSIQAAIDEALEGDTILVHPGIYNQDIDIYKSVNLQSTDGWGATIIHGTGTDNVVDVMGFAGTLLIQGFTIEWGLGNGIDIWNLDYTASVTIRDNFIWRNRSNGIHVGWVSPESNVTIEDNIITENGGCGINFGVGMAIVEGTVMIEDNVIGAWYGNAPWAPDGSWIRTSGNAGDGIYVWQLGMLGTMTIDENTISENGLVGSDGIHVDTVGAHPDEENPERGLHITNNIIGAWVFWYDEVHNQGVGGNFGDGIEIQRSLPATSINIEENIISENHDDGIDFGQGIPIEGSVDIMDNTIGAWTYLEFDGGWPIYEHRLYGNFAHGIYIYGITDSGSVLIDNNAISENGAISSGIHIEGSVRGTLDIIDNTIGAWWYWVDEYSGNAGHGIYISMLDNTVTTIAWNDISGNSGDGIQINTISDKSTTVMISDNTILSNDGNGVMIYNAECGAVVGICQNYISGNQHGVYLEEGVCGVDVSCNIITRNGDGVRIAGDYNNIIRNEISDNISEWESGIHLGTNADGNQIHYNNITGNSAEVAPGVYSYGVYKEGGTLVDATDNWWGDASGPGASGSGSGDWVNDYVLYDPWSTEPNWMCMEGEQEPPVIEKAGASPSMVSLWWDGMLPWWGDMFSAGIEPDNMGPMGQPHSMGPDCGIMFYVKASDVGSGVATVTINLKDLLIDEIEVAGPPVVDGLIPADKLQKFIDQLYLLPPMERGPALDRWAEFLAYLEAVPLDYDPELGCWYNEEGVCELLGETIMFFAQTLHWSEGEFYVILGEIMGQELNLGEFQVEVTVTDFKGNSTIVYIPITIVDYQLPICEGWNLRSTWITLENNKWQDIVFMDGGLQADSILRWNSQYQRWEQFGHGAAGYGWYYGATKVADALMQPLESYWIHGVVNDQIGLITYRGVSAPPSHQMDAGWNLIGAALSWDQPGMRVDDALISIYEATGHCTGYTQVLSIEQYNEWQELFWICDTYQYGSYQKWFYQEPWTYVRDMGDGGMPPLGGIIDGPPPPEMTTGGGYWVFMANPAVLGGFSSTPLPIPFWSWWWD